MKKINPTMLCVCMAAIVLVLLGSRATAQSLSFNQVKLITADANFTTDTVPAGKVWKIENVVNQSNNGYCYIRFSGVNYFLNNTSSLYSNLPFWLPSGTVVSFGSQSVSVYVKVSIIEFNVLP